MKKCITKIDKQIVIFLSIISLLSLSNFAQTEKTKSWSEKFKYSERMLRQTAGDVKDFYDRTRNDGVVNGNEGEYIFSELRIKFTKWHNAWIAYRDADCEFHNYSSVDESGILECKTKMNNDRITLYRRLMPDD